MNREQSLPRLIWSGVTTLFLAGAGQHGLANGWQLDWWTIDTGGGLTHGAGYELTATLGQPAAGSATAGAYRLDAGFWPGRMVPVSTPPALIVELPSDGQLRLEWPASIGPVVVETQREFVPTAAWDPVTLTPVPVGNRLRATLPVSDQSGFFRLRLPGSP